MFSTGFFIVAYLDSY